MKSLFFFIIIFLLLFAFFSANSADFMTREKYKEECKQNLVKIGEAIKGYQADHGGEMPQWLSDLYPKYIPKKEILICPADEANGSPAGFTIYKDPKMPCSYLYEFNPMEFPFQPLIFTQEHRRDYTYKEAKLAQLKYFGGLVPVARCRHHSANQSLDLCYDGIIRQNPGSWESSPEAINTILTFLQNTVFDDIENWRGKISFGEIARYFQNNNRIPDLRQILENTPNPPNAVYRVLGEIYASEGEIDKSIASYNRFIKYSPEDIETHIRLARLYATKANYGDARRQLAQIMKYAPQNPELQNIQAELDAIEDAERIIRQFGGTANPSLKIHYLTKLEEILLASEKSLLPSIQGARHILRRSFGERESAMRLSYLYEAMEKSILGRSGEWKTYTTSNGLINDFVHSISQDNKGILWIGTAKGVCTFDGQNFKPFTPNIELSKSQISNIFFDKQGNIWFGTSSNGVFVYDGENVSNYSVRDGLAGNSVVKIIQDRKGFIWFACGLNGISRYDGKVFTSFNTKDGLLDNMVMTMMEDSKGNFWIGTGKGVNRFDGKTFTPLVRVGNAPYGSVHAIIEDSKGNIWFGTDRGLRSKDDTIPDRPPRPDNPPRENRFMRDGIRDIIEDRDGNLWLNTMRGVLRYDGKDFTRFTEQDGLAGDFVNTIFVDREGCIWFGHNDSDGLSQYNPHGLVSYGVQDGIIGSISSIAEDGKGNIWIASDGNVTKYDGKEFTKPFANEPSLNGIVLKILVDKGNNIWLATTNRGIAKYDGTSIRYFTTLDGLAGNSILHRNTIMLDKNNHLWIATQKSGITYYDGKNFKILTVSDGLPSNEITAIVEDKNGNIWIGTQDSGIVHYNKTKLINYTVEDGLIDNSVTSMYVDSKEIIWIITMNGITHYDGKNFISPPQFAGKLITAITEDKHGHLWLGTANEGIIKTDGKTLMQITTADGLCDDSVLSIKEDSKGNIWIGTKDGLTKYTPNVTHPLILIDSITANKVFTDFSSPVVIPAGRNIKVSYRGISFKTRPSAMQYSYMLDGYDSEWQGPTHERTIDYLNMRPGNYTLKIRAIDRDLSYSQPAQVRIIVQKPFYLNPAILVSSIIITILSLFALTTLINGFVKHRRQVRAYEKLAAQELLDARRVQMSLMPKDSPRIDGLEIAGKCISANTVSGDFYDYLDGKHEDEIALVIADVTGKAMKGAMNAVMTDGILHAKAEEMERISPAILLEKINNILKERTEEDMYVTMQIGLINAKDKVLTLANAGHHALPILLRDANTQYLDVRGFPLGMLDMEIEYDEKQFQLQSGDILVFMTDGITEAQNDDENIYLDSGRLLKLISNLPLDMPSRDIIDAIISDAIAFEGEKLVRDDDMTLIVAKIL